jgi:N utilization substance protein B
LLKTTLLALLETRKVDAWTLNDDYILLLLNAIKASKFITEPVSSFEEDRQLIVDLFWK